MVLRYRWLWMLGFLWVSSVIQTSDGVVAGEASEINPTGDSVHSPLDISLLWFANGSGEEGEHWGCGLYNLLVGPLRKVSALNLVGGNAYARLALGIEKGAMLEAEQARRIGELVEAQRVVWGEYQQQGDQWQVTLHWLNVTTGESPEPQVVTSSDWYTIRAQLVNGLLDALDITPMPHEVQSMSYRETHSLEALELYLKWGCEDNYAESESYMQKAVSLDPNFAEAWVWLAGFQCNQGSYDRGWKSIKQALKLRSDLEIVHQMAGNILSYQKKYVLAEQEFKRALRLNPRHSESLHFLAQVYAQQQQWGQAAYYQHMAVERAPLVPPYHANLGWYYAQHQDKREKALFHLQEAERLAQGKELLNFGTEMALFKGYAQLEEYPTAVEHGVQFIELAREKGWGPQWIAKYEETVALIKTRWMPITVEAVKPQTYTEESLLQALRQRLAPEELSLVVNPMASNAAMDQWACELIAEVPETHTDIDLAQALFEAVMPRRGIPDRQMNMTASEVFDAWSKPEANFDCEALSKLYVALARSVGLQAFYVQVDRDYRGRWGNHNCAIVFVEDKAILVDPMNIWFGVDHRDFIVLDDLQAMAYHLCRCGLLESMLERCRIAHKLSPNDIRIYHQWAIALWNEEKIDEVLKVLDQADRIQPGQWNTLLMRAVMAGYQRQWELTRQYLTQMLAVNPDSAYGQFLMAMIYLIDCDLEQGRESFRRCVQCGPLTPFAKLSRQFIIAISEYKKCKGLQPVQKELDRVQLQTQQVTKNQKKLVLFEMGSQNQGYFSPASEYYRQCLQCGSSEHLVEFMGQILLEINEREHSNSVREMLGSLY